MKSKRLLKFYFSVDELNASLDGLITFYALKSMESCVGMGGCDEKIIKIAEAKTALGKLWRYLDGVIVGFRAEEREVLKYYAELRTGAKREPAGTFRKIKRVTVKFARRARFTERYAEGVRLVNEYYCLTGKRGYKGFFLDEK